MAKQANTRGRPKREYWTSEEGLEKAKAFAAEGLTDEEIAQRMGIARRTLYTWYKKYPDFCESIQKGKADADKQVEKSLLEKALGKYYLEERTTVRDADGLIVQEIVKAKQQPADTTAIIWWLKNRTPERWRDKPIADDVKVQVKDDGFIDALKASIEKDWAFLDKEEEKED